MQQSEVVNQLYTFLESECGVARQNCQVNTPLFSSKTLNSLEFVQLLVFLQNQFSLEVSPLEVELARFDSLELISDFVLQRLPGQAN
jgi:acyl carrier protein